MDPAFSRPGEAPTTFERGLLAAAPRADPRCVGDLWLSVAHAIGLDALMRLLDEFGDAHVWVPSRRSMVGLLWNDLRDSEIHRLRGEGLSMGRIAERLQVSRTTVMRVLRARHGCVTADHGKQAP